MPSPALMARWAAQLAPVAVPVARRLYEQGRFRQLAIQHARTVVDGTFSSEYVDGQRVWVVWVGDEPVVAYPEVDGELSQALSMARPDRRRDPDDLPLQRVGERLRSLRPRRRGTGWDHDTTED